MPASQKIANQIRFWLAFLCAFCSVEIAFAQAEREDAISPFEGLSVVSYVEAEQVINRMAIVYGKIVDVGHAGRVNFLNFDANRRDVFKIVVFDENIKNFDGGLRDLYDDKLVVVRGRVTLYKNVPQIEVTSAEQIQIVKRLPKSNLVTPKRPQLKKRVRIATFNTRNLFDGHDNPYYSDETTQPKPREEMARLAATIKEIDADVVSLQEVESRGYLERFNEVFLTDSGYEVVHYSGNDLRSSGLGVLTRIPVGQVVSHRHRRFKDPAGRARRFSRDLLCVEMLHPFAPSFEVWVTHLKSKRGGAEATEPQRMAETGEIRRQLERKLKREPDARVLLMGDFNDTLDSNPIKNLLSGGQLRSFTQQLPKDAVTYTLPPYQSLIDFIFATPAASKGLVSGSYGVIHRSLSESGSDHNAVVADFEF